MSATSSETTTRRVEIFSAGCQTCRRTIEGFRKYIDPRHDIVVHNLRDDQRAAERAEALGVHTVPAVVVDGALLGCCKNAGPTRHELEAAGVAVAAAG